MIAALLILFPLVTGILCFALPGKRASRLALESSIITLLISLYSFYAFLNGQNEWLEFSFDWIPALGIHFHAGIDGLSLLLVFLTAFLTPLILLSSQSKAYSQSSNFNALVILMQAALIGVFTAKDAFVFYVFWELALIPIYFIALIWGGENRKPVTFKFFLYTTVGSLLMLASILVLYSNTPDGSFDINSFYSLSLSPIEQLVVFVGFFLAFAIKMPIFPFHTWQPDTYVTAPTEGTMLLSGIMLKMGIYGVIRWLLPITPVAVVEWGWIVILLAVIGIIYSSVIALKQPNFKRMVAYVSIAHVGLMAAGLFTGHTEALQGVIIQMLAHGINVVGMFYIVDLISRRTGTDAFDQLGGLRNQAPLLATFFLIILMANVALPLTNGFVGEYLLIVGLFQYDAWLAAVAGLTIIFGAAYMLNGYQKIMLGERKEMYNHVTDVTAKELWVLIPITIMIIGMGVYPKFFLDISASSVQEILNAVHKGYSLK
ncbi:MAG TPA: NADH-quinone oxidoreductase subunit M [Cytophagaceae bacterium]|jgi:NADH-quinone oxidoreductase subunit M|nr:NADH-quinone oxidoreductase subunit M [Cytophagaceae bacterium]